MLESISLPGGMNLPRLRWSRKDVQDPKTAAHLAVAFDTFESRIVANDPERIAKTRPFYAYGLLSFFDRHYATLPSPVWNSVVPDCTEGERHPSDRTHTDRLTRLQQIVQRCVARSINADGKLLLLKTEISPEKAQSLRELHRLCDWVITLDRNAGIEYFDSPRDNKEIYDAYVIDCVPEREDLGCLQLITSTSNREEVRRLFDVALDQMGLSQSRRNAEFLKEQLKALSGRLAIRLTGQKAPTSELIALALCHANCWQVPESAECWTSLRNGFFIPVDDVRDLLPPLKAKEEDNDHSSAERATRPDLIYVSVSPRRGLAFRFIEVKFRRHLCSARSPDVLEGMRCQVESLHERWDDWYSNAEACPSFRTVRRAKLARVLHFYAEKARRHADEENKGGLSAESYQIVAAEIDRMIEKGGDYLFAAADKGDRGWVFCPEYAGSAALEISPAGWETRIFLFGPGLLPDSSFRTDSVGPVSIVESHQEATPAEFQLAQAQPPPGRSDAEGTSTASAQPSPTEDTSSRKSDDKPHVPGPQETVPSVCLGTDLLTGAEVHWTLAIQGNPHLLVAGLPGMGKTTCLLNMCRQMLKVSIRPIIFSYHPDIDQQLVKLVSVVRFIDFHGLGFNPLQVIDRESHMAYLDAAAALRDIFVAIFPELGDLQGERIRDAIKQSFTELGWDNSDADRSQLKEPPFGRFLEILQSIPRPDKGLQNLLARLGELADYGFFELAELHSSLWESEQPIVIRIHQTQNDNLQKAFASLVFYKLYKDMFRRGTQQRITHAVVFDEAHKAARLKLIPTMAKECRKYGIALVLASQEARDFHTSVFSEIANYLVLRVNEADARALVRNVASSDQERVLADRLKQMERFKGLFFCEGRRKPVPVALLA
jgi:DNA polymerase III delta prime subunit